MFTTSQKKNEKKISLEDFKAHAKSVESTKILEMITGGTADDCHVDTGSGSTGSGGGVNTNSVCR